MAKQSIKLKVGGKSYAMNIDSQKEELYRLAERELNQSLSEFESQNYSGFSQIDYISMTALKFAIMSVGARLQGEVRSEEVERLKSMEGSITKYLDNIKQE